MSFPPKAEFRALNVVAAPHSATLQRNVPWLADPQHHGTIEAQIAPGFPPNIEDDLSYFGGRTVQTAHVKLLYVGGSANTWAASDITAIDAALRQALSDVDLETVMAQYFSTQPTVTVMSSSEVSNDSMSLRQADVETMVQNEFAAGTLSGDLESTLFCFLLPPGTELFASDGSNSYNGLAGYRGAVGVFGPVGRQTVYYAVGVYSDTRGGRTNGIAVFDQPWKNVVATFYHQVNEWRTDPDVEHVAGANVNGILGWYSPRHGEIGDIPMIEAGQNLSEVFIEVPLTNGWGTVPIQLMYSNFDHGPVAMTAAAPGSAFGVGGGSRAASGSALSDLVFSSELALDAERLSAIDDLWTACLRVDRPLSTQDVAEVSELGLEMQRLVVRVRDGSRRLRTLVSELAPGKLEEAVRTAFTSRPFGDVLGKMVPQGSFAEQVIGACMIVERDTPSALGELAEHLRSLSRAGEAPGDLPGRLKCAVLLIGAGASALGLVIAPSAVAAGTVIGLVGTLLSTLAAASGWNCQKAGDVATETPVPAGSTPTS